MSNQTSFAVAQPRVAAGALFRDSTGRVLLVKPNYKPLWDIPGGYVEPGETPREACIREIQEELSLNRHIGDPLVVDWAPANGEGDKLLFVFDGGILNKDEVGNISLQAEELERFEFFDRSSFAEVLTDRLNRRISAAIEASDAGRTLYLEPAQASVQSPNSVLDGQAPLRLQQSQGQTERTTSDGEPPATGQPHPRNSARWRPVQSGYGVGR